MSNHQKGYSRDKKITEAIEKHGCLDTEQIRLLLFPDLKHGRRIAQKRLYSLHKRGKLNRTRESFNHSYYYYVGKCKQADHKVGVNWAVLWLKITLKNWESIHSIHFEQDFGILRTDAFVAIKNTWTGAMKFFFIEYDNHLSANPFDKAERYNRLYENMPAVWWADLTDRFPAIIVVTTSAKRAKKIRELVERENVNGLEFRVYDLDDIKGECERDKQA